jgi:hypothetical protein
MTRTLTVHTITDAPPRPRRRKGRYRAAMRGWLAMAALDLSAVDALVTAVLGVPPLAYMARRICEVYRRAYRSAAYPAASCSSAAYPAASSPGPRPVITVTPADVDGGKA